VTTELEYDPSEVAPFIEIKTYRSCDECQHPSCAYKRAESFRKKSCKLAIMMDFVKIENCGDEFGCRECPSPTWKGCDNRIIGPVWSESVALEDPFVYPVRAIFCETCHEKGFRKVFNSKVMLKRHEEKCHGGERGEDRSKVVIEKKFVPKKGVFRRG